MSRPYSPLAVVRGVPHTLLADFCRARQVPLDESALAPDADARQVLAAARNLPRPSRERFDADLNFPLIR